MCRCSQTSIPYPQFVSFNPQFHQVCSSDFVSEEWFSSLFNVNTSNYHPLDFRLVASAQFQVLSILCRTSRQAVIDALKGFNSIAILSPNALSHDVLNSYIGPSIEQFQKNTLDNFRSYHHFVSSLIEEHRFISALRTNFYTRSVPGSNISVTFSAIYPQQVDLTQSSSMLNETCRCDRTSDCVYPAGIYNQSRAIIPNEVFSLDVSPLFMIPGFQVGCVPQNALLQSTLECFYNQSCLDIVISLTDALRTVSALNISNSFSRFSPTTTIGILFDNLMVESWENSTDFAAYFQACAPKACSYSYLQRFFLTYMIATMASIFGGLSVALRITSPVPQNALLQSTLECFYNQSCLDIVISLTDALRTVSALNISNSFSRFSPTTTIGILFDNLMVESWENSTDFAAYFQTCAPKACSYSYLQRFFLTYMIATMASIFGGLSVALRITSPWFVKFILRLSCRQVRMLATNEGHEPNRISSQQIIVRNPTMDQFEYLHDIHSSILSCPCRYSFIPRSTFISNEIQIHPFCKSMVVGCSIMSGLLQSTFECFNDDVCINQFNRDFSSSFTKFNLNATQLRTPIGSLLDEYPTVSSSASANYSAYFEICAPSICQYHYMEQHNIVYIFTTLLGLYGGLTASLHILVWHMFSLYRFIVKRCSCWLQPVHPSS
ncbi:unnamed protein product [Rotaria sordida]|uniref:Uncharacterized protein n=1 Tax=Rotaria sordida TaxID=392033 RepID=A0A814K7X4_9BILA|nr:unnamed protein product [Rotaria sordida]